MAQEISLPVTQTSHPYNQLANSCPYDNLNPQPQEPRPVGAVHGPSMQQLACLLDGCASTAPMQSQGVPQQHNLPAGVVASPGGSHAPSWESCNTAQLCVAQQQQLHRGPRSNNPAAGFARNVASNHHKQPSDALHHLQSQLHKTGSNRKHQGIRSFIAAQHERQQQLRGQEQQQYACSSGSSSSSNGLAGSGSCTDTASSKVEALKQLLRNALRAHPQHTLLQQQVQQQQQQQQKQVNAQRLLHALQSAAAGQQLQDDQQIPLQQTQPVASGLLSTMQPEMHHSAAQPGLVLLQQGQQLPPIQQECRQQQQQVVSQSETDPSELFNSLTAALDAAAAQAAPPQPKPQPAAARHMAAAAAAPPPTGAAGESTGVAIGRLLQSAPALETAQRLLSAVAERVCPSFADQLQQKLMQEISAAAAAAADAAQPFDFDAELRLLLPELARAAAAALKLKQAAGPAAATAADSMGYARRQQPDCGPPCPNNVLYESTPTGVCLQRVSAAAPPAAAGPSLVGMKRVCDATGAGQPQQPTYLIDRVNSSMSATASATATVGPRLPQPGAAAPAAPATTKPAIGNAGITAIRPEHHQQQQHTVHNSWSRQPSPRVPSFNESSCRLPSSLPPPGPTQRLDPLTASQIHAGVAGFDLPSLQTSIGGRGVAGSIPGSGVVAGDLAGDKLDELLQDELVSALMMQPGV